MKKDYNRRATKPAVFLVVLAGLMLHAAPASSAQFTIPVGLLHYTPDTTGSYLLPQTGASMPLCGENNAFARKYRVSGTVQGSASYGYSAEINEPAYVTLHERNGNGTAQVKITPLGTQKTAGNNFGGTGSVTGNTCASSVHRQNLFGEKNLGAEGMVRISHHLNYSVTNYYTLAFELLNPDSVAPGVYSARGGYQFKSNEIDMTAHTNSGTRASPLIPNLSLVVGHVFKIDMPHTSVSLSPSYEDDDTFTGEVRFRAQSNERYSITMQCGNSSATTPEGNCYFAGTQMELATQARFTEQNKSYPLRHGIPAYIDGADFTGSPYEYPGYIDFTLGKIREHGETGKTYFDIVSLTFEADF
ncbi:TPA: hypothetical protein NJ211_004678 [Vibrio parahaemolyticus]|nr:hypothetical protein [Vibrio parahaemolyticus]HCG6702078.1 hypothetical protein [Vibrio parahaemolyticus]HCG6712592.1 hypothetical protein [Vibrio parahaemolyticus]